jgi:hypothetical protein
MNKSQQIRDYAAANPTAKAKEIGEALGVKLTYVHAVLWADKQRGGVKVATRPERPKRPVPKKWKLLHISESNTPIVNPQIEMIEPKHDPVNHPAHYKVGGIETIDFIEAKRLNYNLGNAVKYITRADHKGNRKQDLEKAIWYLRRELDHSL